MSMPEITTGKRCSLLDEARYPGTVMALETTTVCEISFDRLAFASRYWL